MVPLQQRRGPQASAQPAPDPPRLRHPRQRGEHLRRPCGPLFGCGERTANGAPPDTVVESAPTAPSLTASRPERITNVDQARLADGHTVEVEGIYRQRPVLKGMAPPTAPDVATTAPRPTILAPSTPELVE